LIAKDGLKIISGSFIIFLIFLISWFYTRNSILIALAVLVGIFFLFNLFFFRDPERSTPNNSQAVLAPADGRVLQIVQEFEPFYFQEKVNRISIFLSIFNVHINRIPVAGTVKYLSYKPGKFLAAYKEKASSENEQSVIGIVSSAGKMVMFKQIAGLIARRVVCNLKEGQQVKAGERMGMIRYGSRVDIFLPLSAKLIVKVGQTIFGGKSIVAIFEEGPAEKEVEEELDEFPVLENL
jgi:phosphatidylserine decarboxylase